MDTDWRPGSILVVDDEPANRSLVKSILTPLGYQIEEAADGEEALAKISRQAPDLVLLDVQMPKRDGYSVCRELKGDSRTRLIPIVMLTALGRLEDKIKGIELGVDDFLTKPFDISELTTRVRSLLSLKRHTDELEHASDVLQGIALTVEHRDAYTGDHCKRVGDNSIRIGKAMGVRAKDLELLRLGGSFHDLGKIAVPDAVLWKPGRLSPEEMEVMKRHPQDGANLVKPMKTMERVLPLILHHHEKLDGSGYPHGLKGSEIPLIVRILSVTDIYDALATKRPYKEALPPAKCLSILREEAAKGWWDRDVVETLAGIMAQPPIGS
jgi:putative two-component system response regulator